MLTKFGNLESLLKYPAERHTFWRTDGRTETHNLPRYPRSTPLALDENRLSLSRTWKTSTKRHHKPKPISDADVSYQLHCSIRSKNLALKINQSAGIHFLRRFLGCLSSASELTLRSDELLSTCSTVSGFPVVKPNVLNRDQKYREAASQKDTWVTWLDNNRVQR